MHTARPPAFIPPIKKIGIDRNHVSQFGLGRPATDTSGTATEQMGLATLERRLNDFQLLRRYLHGRFLINVQVCFKHFAGYAPEPLVQRYVLEFR